MASRWELLPSLRHLLILTQFMVVHTCRFFCHCYVTEFISNEPCLSLEFMMLNRTGLTTAKRPQTMTHAAPQLAFIIYFPEILYLCSTLFSVYYVCFLLK